MQKTSSSHQLNDEITGILDAIFFAASKPVSIDTIMSILKLDSRKKTVDIIERYRGQFNSKMKGLELVRRKKHYFPKIKEEYIEKIKRLMKPPPLTEKQLEVLALIYSKKKVKLSRLREVFGSRVYNDIKKFVKLGLVSRKNIDGSIHVMIREEAEPLIRGKRGKKRIIKL